MEAPEYFQGECYRACTNQLAVEKQGKAGGDQFVVDDLLDLSKEDEDDSETVMGMNGSSEAPPGISFTNSSTVTAVDSCSNSFSGCLQNYFSGELASRSVADPGHSGDLCEPYEELEELEWLSNFVEESFSSEDLQKLQLISGIKSNLVSATQSDDASSASPAYGGAVTDGQQPSFLPDAPVTGKARSKRSRVATCNWSSRLLLVSSSSASSSSDSEALLVPAEPAKKAAKKKDPSPMVSDGRKCLHCATDKTPQWRTGPMGPKTLCNACGVRYKSGRLVPEYRPATSPTFVMSKHSNSHRKVLELRRQKELQQQQFLQGGIMPLADIYDGNVAAAAAVSDDFLILPHLGTNFRQLI
ncbi:hypothetical protein HPP92_005289 [Vanilla planifolia]|uniref:GATA transcription factor n=1 Tax=Vanilla planifolia TaxID=51239 RepID=A0A835RKI5_VANPL|nr:hypothetical protein HPP92_005576 [Vanilla planifolia]KAG0494295.1 hypothetical protein HPP92_005289 [Vanilla planifolia]